MKHQFAKRIVLLCLALTILFTVVMVVVFVIMGSVPDTLITSFFIFFGGELCILGAKRIFADKKQDNIELPEDEEMEG